MIKYVLTFLAGAAVGAITAISVKKYIENQVEEIDEIWVEEEAEEDAVEETEDKNVIVKETEPQEVELECTISKDEYKKLLSKTKYNNAYYDYHSTHTDADDLPFVISVEEYGETGYELETLKYYEDDIVVDYTNSVWGVADVLDAIGEEWRDILDAGAEDAYVRNDRLEIDYEITKMPCTWDDVIGGN